MRDALSTIFFPLSPFINCCSRLVFVIGQFGLCHWSGWFLSLVRLIFVIGQVGLCHWSGWSLSLARLVFVIGQVYLCHWSGWFLLLVRLVVIVFIILIYWILMPSLWLSSSFLSCYFDFDNRLQLQDCQKSVPCREGGGDFAVPGLNQRF